MNKAILFLTTEQGKTNYGMLSRHPDETAAQFKSRAEAKAAAIAAEAIENGWAAKASIVYKKNANRVRISMPSDL